MSNQILRSPAYVFNIEDQKHVSESIRQKFQGNIIEFSKLNHNVNTLEEQLAPAKGQPISLFLVDINLKPGEARLMGGGSGFKLIRVIKDKMDTKAMIVAYSTDHEYADESLVSGADKFIHKSQANDDWDNGLEEVKSDFLLRYNNSIDLPVHGNNNAIALVQEEGTLNETPTVAETLKTTTEKVTAWIRDIDQTNGRVEIDCEINGKLERRFIGVQLLNKLRPLYSGKPIFILISNDSERIFITFEHREGLNSDDQNYNPFSDLEGSPIFQIPNLNTED